MRCKTKVTWTWCEWALTLSPAFCLSSLSTAARDCGRFNFSSSSSPSIGRTSVSTFNDITKRYALIHSFPPVCPSMHSHVTKSLIETTRNLLQTLKVRKENLPHIIEYRCRRQDACRWKSNAIIFGNAISHRFVLILLSFVFNISSC